MVLSIPTNKLNNILEILALNNKNLEIEVRITMPPARGISKTVFTALMNHLVADKTFSRQPPSIHTVTSFNQVRKIEPDSGECFYQRKTRLAAVDLVTNPPYAIRISAATETPVEPVSAKISNIRHIHRTSFVNVSGNFRIDLSCINADMFELELEFIKRPQTIGALCTPIKALLDTLHTRCFLDVIEKNLFKLLRRNGYPFNKPRNLKRDSIPTVRLYRVFKKLDGTRFLLYATNGYAYLFNNCARLFLDTTDKPVKDTVLDGELVDDVFTAFDILFHDGQDIRDKPYSDRYSTLKSAVAKLSSRVQLAHPYPSILAAIADTARMTDGDGLVFTPINQPYKNNATFKYKPPHLLTIDFALRTIGDRPTLHVYNRLNKFIPFVGTAEYPYSPEDLAIEYREDEVIEFTWDNGFKVFRRRKDIRLPNFCEIALDVWKDIHAPVLAADLRAMFTIDIDPAPPNAAVPWRPPLLRSGTERGSFWATVAQACAVCGVCPERARGHLVESMEWLGPSLYYSIRETIGPIIASEIDRLAPTEICLERLGDIFLADFCIIDARTDELSQAARRFHRAIVVLEHASSYELVHHPDGQAYIDWNDI
jgi:hypothetical protein